MRRAVFCLALTACAPAAPTAPRPPATPSTSPSAVSATTTLPPPKPASVALVSKGFSRESDGLRGTVVARDEAGEELFRGDLGVDGQALYFRSLDPNRSFRLPLRRFPGAREAAGQKLAIGPSGVVLVGANDGSLIAVDISGTPLFELGVRGAVREIMVRAEGGFTVKTVAGDVIVDPALPAPLEPPLPTVAPIRYLAQPPPGGRSPEIVVSAKEAWTLETREDGRQAVHRFDGETWTRVRMDALDLKVDPRMGGNKTDFIGVMLRRGPKGQILLLGARRDWDAGGGRAIDQTSLRVFEWTGSAFQERKDLMPAYERTVSNIYLSDSREPMTYAAGAGGREIVCLDVHCLARGLPSSFRLEGAAPPVRTKAPGWVYFPWEDADNSHGLRGTAFAGDALFRFDFSGVTRNGTKLIDGVTVFEDLSNGKYPLSPDPYGPVRDYDGSDTTVEGLVRGIWARRPDDVWISVGQRYWESALFRWNGKELVSVPRPIPWVDSIWGSGPEDVWVTGDSVAHYDGHEFHRIPGLDPGRIVGGVSGDVWIAGWHIVPAPPPLPDVSGTPAPTPPIAPPSAALSVSDAGPRLGVERVELKVPGEAPMTAALGVEEGPGGVVWLHDRFRLVETDGTGVRALHRAKGDMLLDCQRCAAPRGAGEGLFLSQGRGRKTGLREIRKGAITDVYWSPDVLAVATAPNGDVWAVSAAEDHGVARAFVRTASGLRNVSGLPIAAYSNLAVRANDDVWLSGGMVAFHDGTRTQPAGEGILVHYDGHGFTRHRGPEGALLSVVAVGPAEAWAVGLSGGIVHVKGGVAKAYHLERDSESQRVALRAVAATGPDDVWIAGDGSTLLHWDGKAFMRMDVAGVGADAALTAVVPPRDKAPGWLAGPRGIWRLRWADTNAGVGK
ncbi:MAG: hypothetical protein U0441_22675 [Polyangiaceae bacterium]